MSDAFISYANEDKQFALKLAEAFKKQNRAFWISDWEETPTVEKMREIEAAHTFIFALSPYSVTSEVCSWEVAHAVNNNKRLVPLLRLDAEGIIPNVLASLDGIPFREDDDFEDSFQSLLKIIDMDLDHTKQHTHLLMRAIQWNKRGRKQSFLLRGDSLKRAEQWLKKCENRDPQPNPLQKQYIRMSQIFQAMLPGELNDIYISYSRKDMEFTRKLYKALRENDYDIWVDWADIEKGADWLKKVYAGIEDADNFIFVISPNSIESEICGWELAHAVKNNKRIIPILRRSTSQDSDKTRSEIISLPHPLSFINWLYFREEDDFDQSLQDLLELIERDRNRIKKHTRFLVRAIQWNKKDRNNKFLLRRSDLKEAEEWLKVDKEPYPTDFIKEYIRASRDFEETLRKLPKDVFISYSHRQEDMNFVRLLYDELEFSNHVAWVDWEDIVPTTEWEKELYIGIEAADNFLFVVSPASVASEYCLKELEHAVKHNKRLIRVEYQTPKEVPPPLDSIQWINFNNKDFDSAMSELIKMIGTDLEYVRTHRRLLMRALEWDRNGRDDSFLLRGSDLENTQQWLVGGMSKEPKPTPLHSQYIITSHQQERREQNGWRRSYEETLIQIHNYKKEHQQALLGEIEALSTLSQALFRLNEDFDSMIACLKAGRKLRKVETSDDFRYEIMTNLTQVVTDIRKRKPLKESIIITKPATSHLETLLIQTEEWLQYQKNAADS